MGLRGPEKSTLLFILGIFSPSHRGHICWLARIAHLDRNARRKFAAIGLDCLSSCDLLKTPLFMKTSNSLNLCRIDRRDRPERMPSPLERVNGHRMHHSSKSPSEVERKGWPLAGPGQPAQVIWRTEPYRPARPTHGHSVLDHFCGNRQFDGKTAIIVSHT